LFFLEEEDDRLGSWFLRSTWAKSENGPRKEKKKGREKLIEGGHG
jgi:hypothetical protein